MLLFLAWMSANFLGETDDQQKKGVHIFLVTDKKAVYQVLASGVAGVPGHIRHTY